MRNPVVALALVCACGGGRSSTDASVPDPRQVVATVPAVINRNLDLLFVIDDSQGMNERQAELAAGLPSLIQALGSAEGGIPDLHIGVISTDMGTKSSMGVPALPIGTVGQGGCEGTGKDGRLVVAPGAPLASGAMFLSDVKQTDGTRLRNYTGELANALSMMLRIGGTGCGFEQPLHAMKRSFENAAANVGFLRPDAKLGIIFLGDEDDCSARNASLFAPDNELHGPLTSFRCTRFGVTCQGGGKTPDEMAVVGEKSSCGSNPMPTIVDDAVGFASVVRGLKSDPRGIFVAAIMGNPTPFATEQRAINGMTEVALRHSCQFSGTTPVADPAARLKHFVDQFPSASFHSICTTDQVPSLAHIGRLASSVVGNACITQPLATPLDCIVEDDTGTMKTPIPQCGATEAPPCWKLETDATTCPAAANQRLVIVRAALPPPTTIATMRCAVL